LASSIGSVPPIRSISADEQAVTTQFTEPVAASTANYIDSGAETPISSSVVAIVRFAAAHSASRAASVPAPSAPTTRQSL
jgi:hypothetical protein